MKKVFLFCAVVALVTALYLGGWAAKHALQGEKIVAYDRFHAVNGSQTEFNEWGLLAPLQPEAQHLVDVVDSFIVRVPYPCAEDKFIMVEPADSCDEDIVARECNRIILDSTDKFKIKYGMDYDGTSANVRLAANPTTLVVEKPEVIIDTATGTASPEAVMYDFKKSIQPGAFEIENARLAKQRVERTIRILRSM